MRPSLRFLFSWALFVVALGFVALAVSGEVINLRDARRLRFAEKVDRLVADRTAPQVLPLREAAAAQEVRLKDLESKIAGAEIRLDDPPDSEQVVVVSTAENRVYLRRDGETVFEAVCSTGMGKTVVEEGRERRFDTPTGRFRILSKEENPVWVPPDWHFQEEARKRKKKVVVLNPGQAIDAETGGAVSVPRREGVWGWLSGKDAPHATRRLLQVRNNTVVEIVNGQERELPPGELIVAGGAIVMPPTNTPQRRFDKVLGAYRLNIGHGYALHGTQAVSQLGRSVSHGCIRLGDTDIAKLYEMTEVGDEVIIY